MTTHDKKFKGSFPALITPFSKNKIDFDKLTKLANSIVKLSSGLTLLGSTAESWLLSLEEKVQILKICRELTDKPLIVGISAWNIEDFTEQAKALSEHRPDAFLLTAPPYLNIDIHQAKSFFLGCAVKTKTPIILYHNPKRNGVTFDESIYGLARLYPEIIGFKETCAQTFSQYHDKYKDLTWFLGDDCLLTQFHTGSSINVGGNLYPELFAQLTQEKSSLNLQLWEKLLSIAPNPMVIKQLLTLSGKISHAACRSPLNHLTPAQQKLTAENFDVLLKQEEFQISHQKIAEQA